MANPKTEDDFYYAVLWLIFVGTILFGLFCFVTSVPA